MSRVVHGVSPGGHRSADQPSNKRIYSSLGVMNGLEFPWLYPLSRGHGVIQGICVRLQGVRHYFATRVPRVVLKH